MGVAWAVTALGMAYAAAYILATPPVFRRRICATTADLSAGLTSSQGGARGRGDARRPALRRRPNEETSHENDLPRLDAFLSKNLTGYSRAFLKDMIKRGMVKVDGKVVDADEPILEGQVILIELPETASASSDDFESWVLYEDKRLLVLNKPSGLLMHPLGDSWLKSPEAARAGRETNLAAELQVHRPAILKAGTPRCGIVHRLDRPTSGVLLVAKDPETYAAITDMFKERFMDKT